MKRRNECCTGQGLSRLPEQFAVASISRSPWAIKNVLEEMRNLKKYQYAVASAFAEGTPSRDQKEKCAMTFLPAIQTNNERLPKSLRTEDEMRKALTLNASRGYLLPVAQIAFPGEQGWLRIDYGCTEEKCQGGSAFDTRLIFSFVHPLPGDLPAYDGIFNRAGFRRTESFSRDADVIGIGSFTIATACKNGDDISQYIFECLKGIKARAGEKRLPQQELGSLRPPRIADRKPVFGDLARLPEFIPPSKTPGA